MAETRSLSHARTTRDMSDDGRENNVVPPSTETEDGPKGPPDISGLYSLKLDNLDYSVTLEQLKELFGKHGEIGDVYMPRDYYTKRSRGFAFVRFKDRTAAEVRTSSFVSSADPPREPSPPEPFFCIRRRRVQKQNPDSSALVQSTGRDQGVRPEGTERPTDRVSLRGEAQARQPSRGAPWRRPRRPRRSRRSRRRLLPGRRRLLRRQLLQPQAVRRRRRLRAQQGRLPRGVRPTRTVRSQGLRLQPRKGRLLLRQRQRLLRPRRVR